MHKFALILATVMLTAATPTQAQPVPDNRCTTTRNPDGSEYTDCTVRSGSFIDVAVTGDYDRILVVPPPPTVIEHWHSRFRLVPALSTWSTADDWSFGGSVSLEWFATHGLFARVRGLIGTPSDKPGQPDFSAGFSLGAGWEFDFGLRVGVSLLMLYYPAGTDSLEGQVAGLARERGDERFLGGTLNIGYILKRGPAKGIFGEVEFGAGRRDREVVNSNDLKYGKTWTLGFAVGYAFGR